MRTTGTCPCQDLLPNEQILLGGNYMRPGRTQTGMSSYRSSYTSFHAFTWDWPKNELTLITRVSVNLVNEMTTL